MNKEIEELLNELKDKECYYVGTNGCLYQDLTKEEINLILSYIEQLEKEYNRSLDKLRNLRVENEQLQKEIEELKQQDKNKDTRNSRQRVSNAYQIIQNDKLKRRFNTQKRRRKEEAQKKRLYKSRIDKAIKFIEEKRKVFEWYDTDLFYLESLLKGDSDE